MGTPERLLETGTKHPPLDHSLAGRNDREREYLKREYAEEREVCRQVHHEIEEGERAVDLIERLMASDERKFHTSSFGWGKIFIPEGLYRFRKTVNYGQPGQLEATLQLEHEEDGYIVTLETIFPGSWREINKITLQARVPPHPRESTFGTEMVVDCRLMRADPLTGLTRGAVLEFVANVLKFFVDEKGWSTQ